MGVAREDYVLICSHQIVASVSNGSAMPPALFSKTLFPALQGLDGDRGAAAILRSPDYTLLLERFSIEIAISFGPLKGKIWRIGTMGYSCRTNNVLRLLGALEAALLRHGLGVQAALDVYEEKVR
ncbi:hypothetical protein PAECIP111894_03370 [Paenibacillus pseudetheri]|uniref:Aminotransferase class V domain-containing protein n=1 Tax=Paenibacillus pseudetheri TaxID=2897682 RepID=A0ABM9BEH4_9BACL|nr:hypothetical protein PAECIP111894_03370 [Paenibacillus pseudetheri]